MSDPNLQIQRQIQALQDDLERLRKADASGVSGTWTPTFAGLTGAGSYTYVAQNGFYTRIGNIVHIYGRIGISAISVAPTGGMVVLTFPFTSSSVSGTRGAVTFGYVSNLNLTTGAYLTANIDPGEDGVRLMENFDNATSTAYPAANFTNANCDITFFGSYSV